MKRNALARSILSVVIAGIFLMGMPSPAVADIYINLVAVNGAEKPKTTTVKFNLPPDLTREDILDTNGLKLEYNVNDANFFVTGEVTLNPKETRTFKVKVKDVWKISSEQVDDLKKQITEGYERIGKTAAEGQGNILKDQLLNRIDYISDLQTARADSIEKRIDAYRSYANELKRIKNEALSVAYWRSAPGEERSKKLIKLVFEVENPPQNPKSTYKHSHYLPAEVMPEHVVEAEGFEIRFDPQKQVSLLVKEEEFQPKEKKKYSIGIIDIWNIDQKEIDYLKKRANYAHDFLKNSKYAQNAKVLLDRIMLNLGIVEKSQAQELAIMEHIGAYRDNKVVFDSARTDVETLEQILAVFRETLEKTKVDSVLRKIDGLQSVSKLSDAVFKKKLEVDTAWQYMGWVVLGVALLTIVAFIFWTIRSQDKKITDADQPQAEVKK